MNTTNPTQIHPTGEATGFIPAPGDKGKPITVIGTHDIVCVWLLPCQLQDALADGRRDPELRVALQGVEQRTELRDEAGGFGLEQDAEHADGFDAQLDGGLMTAAFVHEQGIGTNLKREGQRGGFARIKIGGSNGGGNGRCLLLPNPAGQSQSLKARGLPGQAIKLGGDFERDDDFVKQAGEHFDLADAAEVQQHRRVGDDDHDGNKALSEARSSSSICSVTMGMPRSPKARWKAKKSTPASSVAPTRPIKPRPYKEQASSTRTSAGVRRKFSMVSGSVSVTAKKLAAKG